MRSPKIHKIRKAVLDCFPNRKMIYSRDRVQSNDDLDRSAAHGWLAALVKDSKQNNIGQRMSDHQSCWSCELVVDNTVDGKDTKEEKTREVADTMMYHFSWKFLQLGCDMQW